MPPAEARVLRYALLLRIFLGVAGVAGGLFLVLATNATIIQINVGTTGETASGIDTALSGADRHGPALIVIGVFAMVMLAGAVQGARPAMLALAASGVLVLVLSIVSDARNIDDTGALREFYSGAMAGAGNGFYYETLGGALLLISGGGLLVLGGGPADPAARPSRRSRRQRRPRAADAGPAPTTEPGAARAGARSADDWFTED
ncbi:MAG: hypothetical protein JWO02_2238 [Solirubrobacterales bacterium]|nr:hypothetical protein [Solirubrobacterales bacterium]